VSTSVQRGFSIATASAVGLLMIMLAIHNGWFTDARSKSDDASSSSPAEPIARAIATDLETTRGRPVT
jgi:hypothetical protein